MVSSATDRMGTSKQLLLFLSAGLCDIICLHHTLGVTHISSTGVSGDTTCLVVHADLDVDQDLGKKEISVRVRIIVSVFLSQPNHLPSTLLREWIW